MSSIIKVNTVQDTDGNNIINESGSTVTIGKAGNNIRTGGDNIQAADGGNLISQSGTTITLGASGDTVEIASGATLVGGGISWQSSIVTAATHTATAGEGYWIDTSSNACTITLPGSASVGDHIIFTDYARNWATNAVTINQNSLKFQGFTSPNPVYNINGQSIDLVYSGATKGWIPNSDDDVAFKNPPYDAEYLLIAGGGGGAYGNGGGGGAGGFLTNFGGTAISLTAGAVYTIAVGQGGAGAGSGPSTLPGTKGGNSVLSGTGISTVTAEGGGFGAAGSGGTDGGAGGSGGGGEYGGSGGGGPGSGGAATPAGQGNAGGAAQPSLPGTPGAYAGGGGGGAGAAGSNGTPSSGGDGGNGLANSITGSAVTYAGGGGGASDPAHPAGDGGTGGGGNGASHSAPGRDATPGTDGLGGGGGCGINSRTAGSGGDGVVILRVLTSDYSGTTTGSPTVTTDGSHKVIKFTAGGSYTA